MRQEGLKEIALLLATQTVGFSLAMWCSRIMRGWHLSSIGDHAAIDERPISKPETIIESTVLALLTIAAIFGPDRFMSGPPPGIGALYFGFNGLVGTLVLAPAVFFALRLQRFRFVGGVLLLLLIAIPAVVLGTMLSVDPDQNSTGQTVYQDLLISTLAAGCTLCAVIASIRLAGFRLVQRKRPKKQVKRAPVDPFSD